MVLGGTQESYQIPSVGAAFLSTAERCPDHLAVINDTAQINYASLRDSVLALAGHMQGHGVGPASLVALDGEDFMVVSQTILACSLLGAGWIAHKNFQAVPDVVRPTHWLSLRGVDDDVPAGFVGLDPSWFSGPVLATPVDCSGDAALIYANTSGTTGAPKILVLTQQMMLRRAYATAEDFQERETVFASLFSPIAFPYIARFLSAFVNGATVVHSRDLRLWRAAGVNHAYGSVTQVADFMSERVLNPKMPMIHVSGSKLRDNLAAHLLKSFDLVIDLYSSTETNRSFKNIKSIDDLGRIVTAGVPLDSEVAIVNEAGQSVPAGQVGFVRVRNPYTVTGYLNAPDAAARAFRDGWFYSGDLGMFGDRGQLEIIGRTGDVVNVGGIKVNAAAIDDLLLEIDGIDDAMCFEHPNDSGPSEIFAFLVLSPGWSLRDTGQRAADACREKFGATRTPKRMIAVTEVPRAHDGGAKRSMCLQILRAMEEVGTS